MNVQGKGTVGRRAEADLAESVGSTPHGEQQQRAEADVDARHDGHVQDAPRRHVCLACPSSHHLHHGASKKGLGHTSVMIALQIFMAFGSGGVDEREIGGLSWPESS